MFFVAHRYDNTDIELSKMFKERSMMRAVIEEDLLRLSQEELILNVRYSC